MNSTQKETFRQYLAGELEQRKQGEQFAKMNKQLAKRSLLVMNFSIRSLNKILL